jgi:hypothetical protein
MNTVFKTPDTTKLYFSRKKIAGFALSVSLLFIYFLLCLFSDKLRPFFNHEGCLNFGFWGLGVLFLCILSFLLNTIDTVLLGFKIRKFINYFLFIFIALFLIGLLVVVFDQHIGIRLISLVFWIFYFVFVPQGVASLFLDDKEERKTNKPDIRYIISRLLFVTFTIILLFCIHSFIGTAMGITPD